LINSLNLHLSAIDEERFGIRSARAYSLTLDQLPYVLEFCRSNQVKFLIARCQVHELQTVQAMGEQGFALMDTLFYYARRLANAPIPPQADTLIIRPVRPDEAEQVSVLTAKVFRGYRGHYHADPRLDQVKCDEVYESWAYRSCISREVADEVLVAEREGVVVGFITLKIHNPIEGEGPLYGVDPSIQGHGIGRNLVIGALRWFESQGIQKMLISTQITNLSSQKVWVRLGFEPIQAQYTFHKWFDDEGY
jgi:GNAT superfamily N-acetyltransferase